MDDKDAPVEERELASPATILTQVLHALNDLRVHVDTRFDDQASELREVRERFSEMATKEDLKQFITRDLADARETAHNERMNALDSRHQRLEEKVDHIRDDHFTRQLADRDREHAESKSDTQRSDDKQENTLWRKADRYFSILMFVLGPILWIFMNYIFNHH